MSAEHKPQRIPGGPPYRIAGIPSGIISADDWDATDEALEALASYNGLLEQLEAAHVEIDSLNERIELRADEDSIYRVYDAEVERRQQAERERDDERRRAINAETRIIALQRGKL